jgi:phage host-nuclease inhibitor protein Gam
MINISESINYHIRKSFYIYNRYHIEIDKDIIINLKEIDDIIADIQLIIINTLYR